MNDIEDVDLFQLFAVDLLQKPLVKINGRIVQVVGLVAESQGPDVRVGDLCHIQFRDGSHELDAEVVGFRGDRVLLMRGIAGSWSGLRRSVNKQTS